MEARRRSEPGSVPVIAAVYVLLFSTVPGVGFHWQVASLAILCLTAAANLLGTRVHAIEPSFIEWSLLAIALLALATAGLGGRSYNAGYSVAFLLTVLSVMGVVRTYAFETLVASIVMGFALMVVTVLTFHLPGLVVSLTRGSIWLYRFQPFGLHPNLTGFIFGGGAALLAERALRGAGLWRALLTLLALASAAFVLAASARAGVVAMAAAGLLLVLRHGRRLGWAGGGVLLLAMAAAAALLPVFADGAYAYVAAILDLDSATRGWESGATGRFEIWQRGLGLLLGNAQALAVGLGLRTAEPQVLGFATESSYLNILIESGLPAGGAFLLGLLGLLLAATRRAFGRGEDAGSFGFAAALLLYCAVQSIFNRYLLAIGNPLSLALLIVALKAALELKAGRAANSPAPALSGRDVSSRSSRPPANRPAAPAVPRWW